MADTRIADTSQALLSGLGTALTAQGISVPSRQYIHTGLIALDYGDEEGCGESFIVTWMGMLNAGGTGQIIKCAVPFTGRFIVGLFRCVPTLEDDGNPPSAADLNASGVEISTDAMTLAKVLVDSKLQGTLFDNMCKVVGVGEMGAYGPAGGIGGTLMTVFVELLGG